MQIQGSFNRFRQTIAIAALLLSPTAAGIAQSIATSTSSAQPSDQTATTFVIFPGHRTPAGLLPALAATLRNQIAANAAELQPMLPQAGEPSTTAPHVEIVTSDQLVPGRPIQRPITVYLHGDCTLIARPSLDPFATVLPSATLGWVYREHGHVESFIHVECGHIADILSSHALGLTREQRIQQMALAISRVVLHEWIHVEKQTAHHAEHGLAKAQFSAQDLIGDPNPMIARDNARKPAQ